MLSSFGRQCASTFTAEGGGSWAQHGLAREQSEHLGQRRLLGVREAIEVQRRDARLEGGIEIDGDAGHRLRAEHLAPRLLQGVEHLPGLGAARHVPGVERRIVVAQLQRRRVGLSAGAHHLLIRKRRVRTLDPHRVSRRTRILGHELDVGLLGAADRPRHRRGAPAKLVEGLAGPARAVLQQCGHRLCGVRCRTHVQARGQPRAVADPGRAFAVGVPFGHGRSGQALRRAARRPPVAGWMCRSVTGVQVRVTLTPVSGSSVPKQRW